MPLDLDRSLWPAHLPSPEELAARISARLAAGQKALPDRPANQPSADRDVWKRGRCKYQGEEVLEVQQCKTCSKTIAVDVHPCAIHGRCSLEVLTKLPDVKVCATCPDYARKVDLGRIVLINLDRRPDRLEAFAKRAQAAGLVGWERLSAVDGALVPSPAGWKAGPGAAGCRMSHLRALEQAIADRVGVLTVLEDDCEFAPDFLDRLQAFWEQMPGDWRAALLGYQLRGPTRPDPVAPGVIRVVNAQRTHAYVLRGQKAMQDVYRVWQEAMTHIDHMSYRWQQHLAAYAPEEPLCGQAAGKSDISGREYEARDWS